MISMGKNSNVRRTIENYFALAGYIFEPQLELNHHYTIGAMVEAGLGLSLLPAQAAERMRASKLISIIATNEPSFARHVGLISRRGKSLPPAADSFYAFALAAIRRNQAEHRPRTEQKRHKGSASESCSGRSTRRMPMPAPHAGALTKSRHAITAAASSRSCDRRFRTCDCRARSPPTTTLCVHCLSPISRIYFGRGPIQVSLRNVPIRHSAIPFCQGEVGEIGPSHRH